MAKLRHLALSVKELEEIAFSMERVRQSKVAIMLPNGVVSLALLHLRSNDNAPDERGLDYVGLHHMGFLVDDIPASSEAVKVAGGTYHGQILNVGGGPESERKYRDPNGGVIDVTSKAHADSSWRVPTDT